MEKNSKLHLEDIKPFLQGMKPKSNGHITATCPLCGKEEHLHIDEKNGKLLVYCQRCNANGADILREFRRMGAKPQEAEKPDYKTESPVEDYYHVYRNPDGTEAYKKRRRKWADGHKVFGFQYTAADGRTVFTKPENCNNLYNLDLLEKHEHDRLYIVEGEKCADAMVEAGLLATTSNTGAQKNIKLSATDKALLESYPERIVIPDNDDKGSDYAAAWPGAKVMDITKLWPECPKKGDIADYLESGGTAEAIEGYEWPVVLSLDRDFFEGCDRFSLIDSTLLEAIAAVTEPAKRQQVLAMARFRAGELCCKREFEGCWKAFLQQQAASHINSDNMTKFPQQLFSLRCGSWSTAVSGVYRSIQVGTEFKNEYASPIPIMPTELLVNVEDKTEKIRLAYFKKGEWQDVVAQRSIVANKNKIILLADNGVEVNSENASLLVKYLAEAIALNPDILPRVKSIDHMGWTEHGFVPYIDDVKLDCEEQYKSLVDSIASKGTLDEWAEYIKPLWQKNLYLRLTIAASLASVLLEKTGTLPFVLHLWGATGSGKTVALMIAASVWGDPRIGKFARTMNTTLNSLLQTAGTLYSLPLFGDELQTIKPNLDGSYDKLIMQLTEGADRGRLDSNANLKRTKTWKNACIFTGEEPITMANSGGGVKNRVIELECTEQIIADGNGAVNFINSHYGTAGKAFIEYIAKQDVVADYQRIYSNLLELNPDSTEKQLMPLTLMAIADDYACTCIFKDRTVILNPKDIAKFAKSKPEIDPAERAYKYIIDLVAANKDSFCLSDGKKLSYNAAWGKLLPDNKIAFIKSRLEEELAKKGFSFDAVKAKWAAKGYLIKYQNKFIHQDCIGGLKCYTVWLRQL